MELLQSVFDGLIYLVLAARKSGFKQCLLCWLPGLSVKLLFWEIASAARRELSMGRPYTQLSRSPVLTPFTLRVLGGSQWVSASLLLFQGPVLGHCSPESSSSGGRGRAILCLSRLCKLVHILKSWLHSSFCVSWSWMEQRDEIFLECFTFTNNTLDIDENAQ